MPEEGHEEPLVLRALNVQPHSSSSGVKAVRPGRLQRIQRTVEQVLSSLAR
jgi:hypothetical protein